ncbi:HAMP domain-containing histidine kinase [Helicobacter jaachi]|uniref:histidine kinase n=1 Tax=Helicobacter jaachi TaxID=1677920 RepID=A0A4U8TCS6_9HELI|nr:HAMP domain-containing sensor histidine kinase [Helicobacter jaachi]TLD97765.1 HAMP domain-containing histidine kinase [Helicobacter jaachi]
MRDNTKRAIIQILCLYLGTTGIFLAVLFFSLYAKEERYLISQQFHSLREKSVEIYEILYGDETDSKLIHKQLEEYITMPVAIYDKKGQIFFDTLHTPLTPKEYKEGFAKRGNKVILEINPYKYRKMRHKIFIQDDSLDGKIVLVRLKMIAYFILSLALATIVAYFLVRLFLKPLQEKINSLNAFIKDSTHEINTPLSIILMSIETLSVKNLSSVQIQKIERIKLASKSLSHLYKDLVAYNFPHSISNKDENLALDVLLKERLEYFAPFFEQKSIQIHSDIQPSSIVASVEKMSCVVDNLLNNAIKYNKKGGKIEVILAEGRLVVGDSGCGMSKEEIDRIFERYVRCNEFQGGFGIGLTLIKRICDEYHIKIIVQSTPGQGSIFTLLWDTHKKS